MASLKYFVRSKTNTSQIYIRFIIGYRKEFQSKTGIVINMSDWSKEKSSPKQNTVENKKIGTQLKDLDSFIIKAYNHDYSNGIEFTKKWLDSQINLFFNRTKEVSECDYISNYIEDFLEVKKSNINTKKDLIIKLNNLKLRLSQFEKEKNRQIKIAALDAKTLNSFKSFLITDCNFMGSTASSMTRLLKTVLNDAQNNGKAIHHQVKGFVTGDTTSDNKLFLSFEEIGMIKKAKLNIENLIKARDWLVAGCFLGQRASDLLRMNKNMIYTKSDSEGNIYRFIEITQQKTNTKVVIPLHGEVESVLNKYNGDFPPRFAENASSNLVFFNRYIKQVCEIAGIHDMVQGKVYDKENKKNEIEEIEKCKVISTHVCRRSFATNFYGNKLFTTPQLMAITGHTTEAQFLNYIGKTADDWAMQTAKTFKELSLKNK